MSSKLFWNILGYASAVFTLFSVGAVVVFVLVIFTSHQFMYVGYIVAALVLLLSVMLVRLAAKKTGQPAADFFLDLLFWS